MWSRAVDAGGERHVVKNRQFIGATLLTLTDSIIDDLTLLTSGQFPDVDYGVLIQSVAVNGPAYRCNALGRNTCVCTYVLVSACTGVIVHTCTCTSKVNT